MQQSMNVHFWHVLHFKMPPDMSSKCFQRPQLDFKNKMCLVPKWLPSLPESKDLSLSP